MKNSSEPAPTADRADKDQSADSPRLEFPIAPDFVSRPPRLDFQVILKRCAETMPWRNARQGESERRLREKIPVEFVL